nr:MAG TPA: hypothetical protein [Caudoviricetes sp.]
MSGLRLCETFLVRKARQRSDNDKSGHSHVK